MAASIAAESGSDATSSAEQTATSAATADPRLALEQLGLEIASAASIANALAGGAPFAAGLAGLARRLSGAGHLERLLAATDHSPLLTVGLRAAFRSLAAHVAHADRLSRSVAEQAVADRDRLVAVAMAWRKAANFAYVAHWLATRVLPPDTARGRSSPEDAARLATLLQSVAWGGWPALDGEGQLTFPHGADRRGAARMSLTMPIRVYARSRWHDGVTTNVSSTGLGLEAMPELTLGEIVAIALPNGSVVQVSVAWVQGSRAGVTIRDPADGPRLAQLIEEA